LLALAYYKYSNFVIANLEPYFQGLGSGYSQVILPIGISFYTFTQIAFLVDCYRGRAREYKFMNYLLFVTYFPHLIAGPILHHREMIPQFQRRLAYVFRWECIAVGLTIFAVGLFKKVVIADNLAPYADFVFNHAETARPSAAEAWGGALAYTLQLYFDFSGYSDMAIGLARLFGTRLPANFWSPYKAASIIDFWRCWHMTLSRFLRDYLYIPLGGNKHGRFRRYLNLFITMVLGGMWHGAGWTFLAWGALHSLYLIVNNVWRGFYPSFFGASRTRVLLSWIITLLCVIVAWVFFRAPSMGAAIAMLQAMVGVNGIVDASATGWHARLFWHGLPPGTIGWHGGALWISVGFAISLLCPNLQEIMRRYRPTLDAIKSMPTWTWRARIPEAVVSAALLLLAVAAIAVGQPTSFLYFQF
jgi:D-alanyl-lipoteichoic acid acyltransferase DltB (MBOAT superfamily)